MNNYFDSSKSILKQLNSSLKNVVLNKIILSDNLYLFGTILLFILYLILG